MSHNITDACIGCTACARICPVSAVTGERKGRHTIDQVLCINCGACGRVCPKGAVLDSYGSRVEKLKKDQWPVPKIDAGKCFACENCLAACPTGVLVMKDERLPLGQNYAVLTDPDKCVSCGWCVTNCQFDAIVLEVRDAVL